MLKMIKTSLRLCREMSRRNLSEREYLLMFRPFFIVAALCVCHIFTMATIDAWSIYRAPIPDFEPTSAWASVSDSIDSNIVNNTNVNNNSITDDNTIYITPPAEQQHTTLYERHAISSDFGCHFTTDDGNMWEVEDFMELPNGADVIITFDSMGTDELSDDKIIKIIPVEVEKG